MRGGAVGRFLMPIMAAVLIFLPGGTALALEETEFWDLQITEETEIEETERERQTENILPEIVPEPETETVCETGKTDFPPVFSREVPDERFIRVSWTDRNSGLCLVQGVNDDEIRAITEGVWRLEFEILTSGGDGLECSDNGSCTYPLVLPSGSLSFDRLDGQDSGGFLSWSLEPETGILTITENLPAEQSADLVFDLTVTVFKAEREMEAEEPSKAQIGQNGSFDPVNLELDWCVSATIPSFAGSCRSWTIYDYEDYDEWQFGALGDLRVESVSLSSAGYRGEIPQLEEAGEEDLFAWQLVSSEYGNHSSVSTSVLALFSRCACSDKSGCRLWEEETQSCARKVQGGIFCDCWQHPYNAELCIHYRADARALLQKLEDNSSDEIWATIWNDVTLKKDGDWAYAAEGKVELKKFLTKAESASPSAENGLAGSYEITVNPNHYAFDGADCICVTDRLQNLAHLADGTISAVLQTGKALELIDESEALALCRSEDTENRFYSVQVKNLVEGSKLGEILTIQLWFPTDLACSILYDAMIIDPDPAKDSGTVKYGNTAEIGGIEVSLSGSLYDCPAADVLNRRRLILSKYDAAEEGIALEGAEFGAFLYRADLSGKKDVRLATLITDEEGKAVFCSASDAEAGAYLIQADQLYYLKELRAPEGYERDENLYWFYWAKDGIPPENLPEGEDFILCGSEGQEGAEEIQLRVPNRKKEIPGGPELPETGGPGRGLFPAAALLFFALAAALSLSLFQLRDLFCRWYTYKLKQSVLNRQNG